MNNIGILPYRKAKSTNPSFCFYLSFLLSSLIFHYSLSPKFEFLKRLVKPIDLGCTLSLQKSGASMNLPDYNLKALVLE